MSPSHDVMTSYDQVCPPPSNIGTVVTICWNMWKSRNAFVFYGALHDAFMSSTHARSDATLWLSYAHSISTSYPPLRSRLPCPAQILAHRQVP
ncbi:hypothetical protein LINPERPRIM_LOCUS39591, partial [Linum perenne]